MSAPFQFYRVRGYSGYLHAECWPAFELQHSVFDALGGLASRPMLDSELWDVGLRARKEPCIHCNQPLGKLPLKENPGD